MEILCKNYRHKINYLSFMNTSVVSEHYTVSYPITAVQSYLIALIEDGLKQASMSPFNQPLGSNLNVLSRLKPSHVKQVSKAIKKATGMAGKIQHLTQKVKIVNENGNC